MKKSSSLFCGCILISTLIAVNCILIEFNYFKIGAFDVEILDQTKLADEIVLDTLVKVSLNFFGEIKWKARCRAT